MIHYKGRVVSAGLQMNDARSNKAAKRVERF